MNKPFKPLWVFGNAVQDITVEVDVERLSRESSDKRGQIRLGEGGPEVKENLKLRTQFGSQSFAVTVQLRDLKKTSGKSYPVPKSEEGCYKLDPGGKYTLEGDITDEVADKSAVFLPCESISWGGGGANMVTFLRALAPNSETIRIRYTDIAMSRSLPALLWKFEGNCRDLGAVRATNARTHCGTGKLLDDCYRSDPVRAEALTDEIATVAAGYAPERSLEIFLASLPVESVLHRPTNPRARRNWVFSRFKGAQHGVDNKIVLRGSPQELPSGEQSRIARLLERHVDDVGAIVLNSLKDAPLFRAAYRFYQQAYRKDHNVVAILAMTEPMQAFTNWVLRNGTVGGALPPFILVFNETEAQKFARRLGDHGAAFMKGDDLPDVRRFAQMVQKILDQFPGDAAPRIYVTLGRRGSLGADGAGNVVYVSSFSRGDATIFDTNACGDAYCAAIALLEWAKRQSGRHNIAEVDFKKSQYPLAEEMQYFMAVATATAYCKATNRRGRVYAADLRDLLQHYHLARKILPSVKELAHLDQPTRPEGVDSDFKLREPAHASYVGISEELDSLIS